MILMYFAQQKHHFIMTSNSRRAFLKGRVPATTNWARFYERLSQEFPEQLQSFASAVQGIEHGIFAPTQPSQVHAVFLLAQHFEVQLGLVPADLNTIKFHPEDRKSTRLNSS